MTLDRDKIVIMCNLVADGPARIRGATQRQCQVCDRAIHFAPSSARLEREATEATILCMDCAHAMAERLRAKGEETTLAILPESLEDVLANLPPAPSTTTPTKKDKN